MMSKKQWTVLLCLFLMYLLLGAGIFYNIESAQEQERRETERIERIEIEDLLLKHYKPSNEASQDDIMDRLSNYCGRPVKSNDTDDPSNRPKWDFYHSFFFAFTVVSTIGYGNLAPTTMASRILMIFYGLIGIPINGILLATLGDFFGKTFINAHQKWKSYKPNYEAWKLGLCGQIAMYLIPGFLFFIFIPALVMMIIEDWEYDLAVYYAFVTLTTIGFGDYVAGVNTKGYGDWFVVYEIFLIVWIVFGLGYLVMVLGFITRGMRSKHMARLEHKLANNIRTTHSKIWNGFTRDVGYLRRVLNEIYMLRFKPIYRDDFQFTPTIRDRSSSCPDLSMYREESPRMQRRRAYSESVNSVNEPELGRVQSDTDLERIDRKATFASAALVQPCELLARVVNALGTYHSEADVTSSDNLGVHGFSDSQILSSEQWRESGWTIGDDRISPPSAIPQRLQHRERAYSEYTIPVSDKYQNGVDWTWSGPLATKEIQEIRKKAKFTQGEKGVSVPVKPAVASPPRGFLARFNPFNRSAKPIEHRASEASEMTPEQYLAMTSDGRRSRFNNYSTHTGVSRGSIFPTTPDSLLEETTIGDLLRAITSLHSRDKAGSEGLITPPRRKLGTASLTPPKLPSLLTLFPPNIPPAATTLPRRGSILPSGSRRMSLKPAHSGSVRSSRRFSVRPVDIPTDDRFALTNPPPYTPLERDSTRSSLRVPAVQRLRRFSLHPAQPAPPAAVIKTSTRWRPDLLRNEAANATTGLRRTRHDSLTDIRIDKV